VQRQHFSKGNVSLQELGQTRRKHQMPTWLITGCSSGLGRHLAQAVLANGWNAVVTARDPATVEEIVAPYPSTALALALDVTNQAQVTDTAEKALARFGHIDVLVNNAGYGFRSAVEEATEADLKNLFATNYFGLVEMTKALLPSMRARRQGFIVNVSSIAGRAGAPGSGHYAASKFAVEGMSDALRKEVAPLGIKVMTISLGALRTEFYGRSLQQSLTAIADYAETAGRRRKESDRSYGTQPGDPARAAQAIIRAVESQVPPARLAVGRDAVARIREALEEQRHEIDAWEEVSSSIDFTTTS
jgi:NAD(P)-dependent dehydrogenase (short-subunit alcohol dehydrogenase family)